MAQSVRHGVEREKPLFETPGADTRKGKGHRLRFGEYQPLTASSIGKWLVIGRDSSTYVSDGATALIKAYTGEERGLDRTQAGGVSFDDEIDGKMITGQIP